MRCGSVASSDARRATARCVASPSKRFTSSQGRPQAAATTTPQYCVVYRWRSRSAARGRRQAQSTMAVEFVWWSGFVATTSTCTSGAAHSRNASKVRRLQS